MKINWKGCGRRWVRPNWGITQAFIWRNWRKPQTSIRVVLAPAEIQTRHCPTPLYIFLSNKTSVNIIPCWCLQKMLPSWVQLLPPSCNIPDFGRSWAYVDGERKLTSMSSRLLRQRTWPPCYISTPWNYTKSKLDIKQNTVYVKPLSYSAY